MAFGQSRIPHANNSPLVDVGDSTAKKCPSRVVSDEQERPGVTPLSSCSSQGSSDSSSPQVAAATAPVVCITGIFSNIDHKYCVDTSQVLGSGCQGIVRECIERATGRRFAVKSIRKSDPEVKAGAVTREILLLREMDHGNIIRLVDVCEDAECVHLVTDLCQGGELFDEIVERSADNDDGSACFAEVEAAKIIRQVLTAVAYMHDCDIVHRDIKPENILFETDKDGSECSPVKIIDFGLSRKHRAYSETAMRTLVGTPYYIAPEVLRERYDRSCDLWSVGVIAYIMLCGYPPFNGVDNDQVHRRVLRGKYYFPTEDWESVSEDAVDFIHHLLQMDPRKRMTAEEALAHPWILEYGSANATMVNGEEERQDEPSVEVVHSETRSKHPSVQWGNRSPHSPPRKVRRSMFAI